MEESCVECKKDINVLYDKANDLDKRLTIIDMSQTHYTETLEKVVESNEKLVNTLQSMQLTFVKMDNKIDSISRDICDTKGQVSGIDNRMKKIENENTFGILGFLNKYFPWVAIGIGIVGFWASKYVKF